MHNSILIKIFIILITTLAQTSCSKSRFNLDEIKIIEGTIVKVSDGDTVKIKSRKVCVSYNRCDKINKVYKIRLFGIDAPESKQKYGRQATKALDKLINHKQVTIKIKEADKYKRLVGKIYHKDQYVNYEMVKQGNAWVYRYHNKSRSFIQAETAAKQAKIGLWSQDKPMNPRNWRKKYK